MNTKGICRVCELLDNDKRKKVVNYCYLCKALICEKCEPNYLRRGMAALKNFETKI